MNIVGNLLKRFRPLNGGAYAYAAALAALLVALVALRDPDTPEHAASHRMPTDGPSAGIAPSPAVRSGEQALLSR